MPKDPIIIDFEIIWKKINHTLTENEETILSQWLNENPSHQQYLDNAIRYYQQGSSTTIDEAETEKVWKAIKNKKLKHRHHKSKWIISLTAAAALILFLVTYLLPPTKISTGPLAINKAELIKPGSRQATLILDDGSVHDLTTSKHLVINEGGAEIKSEGTKLEYTDKGIATNEIRYNTLSIPRGGEFFLQLADGTKVWLNSETILRYPVQFTGTERRVELTGEAFFEVAKNEKIPFLVESGEQVIKVLGTEFNISSYKENQLIYTTLIKGRIEVFIKNKPDIKQILTPNEQSSVNKSDALISKREVDPYQYTAWKEGRFVFLDQNLGDIMKTLSKWYNVDVVFAKDELRGIRFTGNLERYSDFGKVLSKIGKTNEVKFNIENRLITISE
jgi:ferric-dicitrate binding protein FerR (iron transport regulator)